MLMLASRRRLMGELANSPRYSAFCWALCGLIIALDLILLASSFLPAGGS